MCLSRRVFKSKLKWCQDRQEQIKRDILAMNHAAKDFKGFWKNTKVLIVAPGVPVSIGGVVDSRDIANNFRELFTVKSPLANGHEERVFDGGTIVGDSAIRLSAKDVAGVIKAMQCGKSPGHDGLSIEHLKYAGVHLPRVLTMFFTLCLRHTYLPDRLMRTVIVPIIKNRTGDVSDITNYRPISLATVTSKVLDSLLTEQLKKHVKLHDAQFGFRAGLSTETAIVCLKRAIGYYKDRKTPIYACFLVLSKAFDLVAYHLLWEKLSRTTVPVECITLLKYWYGNQVNQIKELSSTHVGCHIDGVGINNISNADDMVLLGPSINAIRQLVSKIVPPVMLGGVPLKVADQFKYLGHMVTPDLRDDAYIERERRALSVREARTDGFHAIRRKRVASLLNRVCGSSNTILSICSLNARTAP
ncbi:uncharacterized protein LOC134749077 [Cydia strobilella]|uniref:uncharacterized protein LOC134749077 n=1 Tax=Cydia strobilella TaxID=1100964 RepID=UPI003006972B